MTTENKNLPILADLIKDDISIVKQNQLNILLNQKPPSEWLREHPFVKVETLDKEGRKIKIPYVYIPIERMEWLMTRIFIQWRVEVKEYSLIGNYICCSIRLHYLNPITGVWEWQDGVGAQPLQTEKNAGAIEFDKLRSAAVQMALPAAKTYAKKDAMDELGCLFGKDLNRNEAMNYYNMNADKFTDVERVSIKRKISDLLAKCEKKELRDQVMSDIFDAENDGKDDISFLNEQLNKLQDGK